MDPSEHVVFEGVLSDMAVGQLESGESRVVEMAICFLVHGRFEISADVKVFNSPRVDSRAGIGNLIAIVARSDDVCP